LLRAEENKLSGLWPWDTLPALLVPPLGQPGGSHRAREPLATVFVALLVSCPAAKAVLRPEASGKGFRDQSLLPREATLRTARAYGLAHL
jgi:hypothetical protein